MKRPLWQASSDLWEVDGSLRDVYVRGVSIADWSALIQLAKSYGYSYSNNGEPAASPNAEEIFAHQELGHVLTIKVGTISVCCHFFDCGEIELDVDPREVKGPHEHDVFLEFIERLGQAVGKVVFVTPENLAEKPIISYDSQHNAWLLHG